MAANNEAWADLIFSHISALKVIVFSTPQFGPLISLSATISVHQRFLLKWIG
jgi:hypothetical protein